MLSFVYLKKNIFSRQHKYTYQNMKNCVIVCIIFIFGLTSKIKGQGDSASKDTSLYDASSDLSITAFPIAFFLPETGLAFGALGITVFNIGEEKKWRKSQVGLGLAYTLKNQILIFIPYELYWNDKWSTKGEIGYYRYFYNYFGTGISSRSEDLEIYGANFPRFINTVSYRLNESFFIGFRNKLDIFEIPSVGELLETQSPLGIDGGVYSTAGVNLTFDNRDDIFYPSKGVLTDFIIEGAGAATLSDYDFLSISLEASYFYSLAKNHILAVNAITGTQLGDAPFFNYFFFIGRGYNDRRFINKNTSVIQAEYRFPIYKRLTGVTFASVGSMANEYVELFSNPWKPAFGGGLRFQLSKKQKSNLRVDFAKGLEEFQFYITIGEAF